MPTRKKSTLDLSKLPARLAEVIGRLQGEEHLEFEMKSAQGGLPKDIWPTVSAYANTQGGWILLGIVYRDGKAIIEGVKNAPARLQEFTDLINNPQKISYRACGVKDAVVEAINGKQLIVIRIPAAPRKERPVYINMNPYTGTYIRMHGGDYQCKKPEVDLMMREASNVGADSYILDGFTWDDLDTDAFARYRRRYQTLNPASPWNSFSDQDFLKALGGFRHDRSTGKEGITVAGILLVGKPEAIREWRGRHLIDYRALAKSDDPQNRWIDRLAYEGHLFGAFETIYPRLTHGLPVPFRLEGATRVDESNVHTALREALVNLLVHADYAVTQPSLIFWAPEGYLFRNPGSSRVPSHDILKGDRSDPRNPELVKMFRLIGLAEEAGTGIPKIIQSWHRLGFRMPLIDTGTERYEFSLGLRHAHLLSEEDRSWLHSMGEEWSEVEQLALVSAKRDGSIDNQTIRRLTGEHASDVTKNLVSLRDRGLLELMGSGRGARYRLGPRARAGTIPDSDFGPLFQSLSDTEHEALLESSGDIPTSSEGTDANSEGIPLNLYEIAKAARENSRLDPDLRDNLIIELCRQSPLSLRDLAKLLDRNADYIRAIVKPLIALGRLRHLYPNQPNHPQQKYTAVQQGVD